MRYRTALGPIAFLFWTDVISFVLLVVWAYAGGELATLVESLGNKCALRRRADALGLGAHLPDEYTSLESATYPAILKWAEGTAGRDVHIVNDAEHARSKMGKHTGEELIGSSWALQELVRGRMEHSVSMLIVDGSILEVPRAWIEPPRHPF